MFPRPVVIAGVADFEVGPLGSEFVEAAALPASVADGVRAPRPVASRPPRSKKSAWLMACIGPFASGPTRDLADDDSAHMATGSFRAQF